MKSILIVLLVLFFQSVALATPLMQAAVATTTQAAAPLIQISNLLESISESVFLGAIF
jgi:hypothetical protein